RENIFFYFYFRNVPSSSTTLVPEFTKKIPSSEDNKIKILEPDHSDFDDTNNIGHISEEILLEEATHNIIKDKKIFTRKRQKNTSEWTCNKRKSLFDQGLEYISSRKKVVPARKIRNKKDCVQKCRMKCSHQISDEQRKEIFKNYYLLSAIEKKNYILHTTEAETPWRRRNFRFYFEINNQKIQVCKDFYTGTLCISQKPIYTVHNNKTSTKTLPESKQGKHQKRVTSLEDSNLVKEHINMIPRVESHYCRKKTNKEYLESGLSIKKLYELYLDFAGECKKNPVSFAVYRKIFCNYFNIAFHKPRKDRCDTCEEIKLRKMEKREDEESQRRYTDHLKEKEYMREEKQRDKESGIPLLCFDLENVLTCPKADIKNFFYKSKLNVYNMTGHLSVGKYCAVWTEALHGRKGNDIASAVYKIVGKVLEDHPEFTKIILWSDSCVPQNRNSLMSYALSYLIQKHQNVQNISMKFSVPGHACIQEVDAIHSAIERTLNKVEYYSPISHLRYLLKVNRQNPYTIIQMKQEHFIDFQSFSSQLNYNAVPFSKVVALEFSKSFFELKYKDTFDPTKELKTVNLHQRKLRKGHVKTETEPLIPLQLKKCDKAVVLPPNKIDALKSMFKYIPEVDKEYYECIFLQK
ncbi:uncharacterized protein, partial [Diabrotica undecimpunctata]|uniref:uncharacterized protein n=1 Tax=Diabrotica undecimpunctata TaxID=50387 RepID=UPI003B63FA59